MCMRVCFTPWFSVSLGTVPLRLASHKGHHQLPCLVFLVVAGPLAKGQQFFLPQAEPPLSPWKRALPSAVLCQLLPSSLTSSSHRHACAHTNTFVFCCFVSCCRLADCQGRHLLPRASLPLWQWGWSGIDRRTWGGGKGGLLLLLTPSNNPLPWSADAPFLPWGRKPLHIISPFWGGDCGGQGDELLHGHQLLKELGAIEALPPPPSTKI